MQSSLEVTKVSHAQFNDALKTKADVTAVARKVDSDDVTASVRAVQGAIDELRRDLAAVHSERSQFRSMLREVLYMHRRAQALSGGVEGALAVSAAFALDDAYDRTPSPNGAAPPPPRRHSERNIFGFADPTSASQRATRAGEARVPDPVLPLVRSQSVHEAPDDAVDPRSPRLAAAATNRRGPSTAQASSARRPQQQQQQAQQPSSKSSPGGGTGVVVGHSASFSASSPASAAAARSTATRGQSRGGGAGTDLPSTAPHPSPPSAPRRAQQLVDEIAASSSSSPRASSSRRGPRAAPPLDGTADPPLPALEEVGDRDVTQRFVRKIFTPGGSGEATAQALL
jgi:hypothetical protein